MSKHKTEDIRNLALVGHGAAGKTSLADALLFKAGAVERRGNVEDGTSVSDYDEEEKARKFSVDTSLLHLEHKGKRLHVLDTPGYPDFVGAALNALLAVETAVVVISASSGVQVNTRRLFHEAGRRGLGRIIVLNKLDADNVDFDELLTNVQASFGKNCVLFNAPIGIGHDFSGVVCVLDPPATQPKGCDVDLAAARSQLIDCIVESDEALMEKYLTEGTINEEDLTHALPKALAAGTVVPIFCTAAKKDIGVAELLDALARYGESPLEGPTHKGERHTGSQATEVTFLPTEQGEAVAQVFKVVHDKFVGTLSFIKVFSGKLTPEQSLVNQRTRKSARSGGLLEMQGKTSKAIPEAIAGDIVAVAKVEGLHIGDVLATTDAHISIPLPAAPTPMFGLAVEPKARGDEAKISGSLAKIADEDSTFKWKPDDQTKEMVIRGMTQLHLDVIQHRLKQRYGLEINTKEPKIPYRETITGEADATYRHKKQSGGRGQFGEVHLRVMSLPREISTQEQFFAEFATKARFEKIREDHSSYDPEHNFGFIDTIVGGTIPVNFVPAILKGCRELLERGALAGYRIQDVAVQIIEGKDHPVDSSEAAFKIAGRLAFKNAFMAAHPTLLEPMVIMEVTLPSKYTGAILGDLNTRRARVEHQDSLPGDLAVIRCKVPLAEVTRYAAQLGSITQGSGSYSMEFSHYEVVPALVKQQIVSKAKMAHDEDEE